MASAYTERQRKVTVIFIDSIAVSGREDSNFFYSPRKGQILISMICLGGRKGSGK